MLEAIRLELMRVCLYGAAASFLALALFSRPVRSALARLDQIWRGMTVLGRTVFLSLLIVFYVYGSNKTNSPPLRIIRPLPVLPTVGQSVSETEIAKGYRQVSVVTNENQSYDMPTNATIVGNWHKRGTFGEWMRLELGDFAFPLGTNNETFSSFSAFNDGKIRPTPRDVSREICAVGTPMLAVQGTSCFWIADGEDASKTLTWEHFFLGADTNVPVSAQIALYANGDFLTRSNGVETTYSRVNPDDWDDDGRANEKDANPTEWDGDFFGTANALPANANANAYYRLDLSVTGVLGVATIRVTCDGPSDLGDHVIIARTNDVCHVPLLAGATYAVESGLPIVFSSVSSEYASIVTNSETSLTVSLPLEFSFESVQMRGGPAGYAVQTSPIDVMPHLMSVSGGCCSCTTNGTGFSWSCIAACACAGSTHTLYGMAIWEGYVRDFEADLRCPCASEYEDENGAAVNISFSDAVIVFESAYTNAPSSVIPRRSTTTMLTCRAMGGQYGGNVVVTLVNGNRLLRTGGDVMPCIAAVAAGEETVLSASFEGVTESSNENDIVAVAVFTENMTGRQLTNETYLTSARVELVADALFPTNRVRHVFGPQESVEFRILPALGRVGWSVGGTNAVGCIYSYLAPNEPTNDNSTVSVSAVDFSFGISVIAPAGVDAIRWAAMTPSEWGAMVGSPPISGEVAVGLSTSLRLIPDYVSFGHLYFQEGECAASGVWGFFEPYSSMLLPHDANAGALNEIDIASADNGVGDDCAGASFGVIQTPLASGGFEYAITNYWYVKDGSAIVGPMHPFRVEHQVFTLSATGDLSVSKYSCTATRGTNDVTIVTKGP